MRNLQPRSCTWQSVTQYEKSKGIFMEGYPEKYHFLLFLRILNYSTTTTPKCNAPINNPCFITACFINPGFITPCFINPCFIPPFFINPCFINRVHVLPIQSRIHFITCHIIDAQGRCRACCQQQEITDWKQSLHDGASGFETNSANIKLPKIPLTEIYGLIAD